ncbi:hypothetical protein [Cellulomonas alba]|uniref:Uncharacterized protein n=1 Tax=Cellulomonas alba TaxID=3053467 RepID=A0ABT7SI55_9CELL|nr:hypothetical protein [Cellulomonas alba]MDM7855724.1 hypothetical protein [Cellulomonas alba]
MSDELHDLLARAADRAAARTTWDTSDLKRRVRRGRRVRSATTAAVAVAAVGVLGTAVGLGPHARSGPPLVGPGTATHPVTPTGSSPSPSVPPAGDGACGARVDAHALTGRAGDAAVGAVAGVAAPGATTVDVVVAGASVSGSHATTAAGPGTAVLLRGGTVVARAATTPEEPGGDGDATAPSFLARADLPVVSCAAGAALPDGDYVLAVVQPVRAGDAVRTVLAGGEVVTVTGGRPATLCDAGPLTVNATEERSTMRWAQHGIPLTRTLGVPEPALPDGFAASPRVVLTDASGRVIAVQAGVPGLRVVRGEQPVTYATAVFPHSCADAVVPPGTYRVLDVVDADPWGSAGTVRSVSEIGTVTIPLGSGG